MTGTICGTGSYVPSYRMDNNEIATLVDTSDEWIRERTGIARRHIAVEETTVSMAVNAAENALEDAGVRPEELDVVLVSTISPSAVMPCTACEVQREIGAVNAFGFDLNAACTGFVFAYQTALSYIESGMCRTALVIGCERLSDLTDWKDRGTCILFGDGAGAAVVKASGGKAYRSAAHSDGAGGQALTCGSLWGECLLPGKREALKRAVDPDGYMRMDGRAVFKFAVKKVPEVITEVLKKNDIGPDEIDFYILHQANGRIVSSVAKRLGQPESKFPMNLEEYGNTSSASIPILLDELNRGGTLSKGKKIVLAGFGAGLSWGACIVEWQRIDK